jgi:glycosyltransferase involved in cell wall biosynthesis
MKNIYYFSPYCLLRPTTNRIYDMRLCDGFSGHGKSVTIIHPFTYMKDNVSPKELPRVYGLHHEVKVRMMLTPLTEHAFKSWRFFSLLLFSALATIRIFVSVAFSRKAALIISRDAKSLLPAIIFHKTFRKIVPIKIIYIAAEVKSNPIFKFVVQHVDGVIAGVSATRDAINKIVPLPPQKYILSLAPVPEPKVKCSKAEARKEIGYAEGKPLIVYTGKLGMDVNELLYIFEAARLLSDYEFLFTGGRPSAVESVKKYCESKGVRNVRFTGFMNDSTYVRYYQLAADVLVSYYTAKDHPVEFNYPQKVNEYLTTGNPVVTPDFPATRDVLNKNNVIFVQPDNPADLARGIKLAVQDKELVERITRQASMDIRELSFDHRTAAFIRFAETL